MGTKNPILAFIFVVILYQKTNCDETNTCSFSLKMQILTCDNVTLKHANLENLIVDVTNVLILKNSDRLILGPGLHTKPFEVLKTYQLLGNRILDLRPFTFQKLTNLRYIKINDNNYSTVLNNSFYGLSQLEVLNLNNNSIHVVESNAFYRLDNLEILELTHNSFKVVPSRNFEYLKRLKSLFLYHNNIEILEENCLIGLSNLNVLDLTYNRILEIDTEMFNGLKKLTHLYLSFNQIEKIKGDFDLEDLQYLYLQNNRLKTLSSTIFNSLRKLLDLDISKNKLQELDEYVVYNLTRLRNFHYNDNNLTNPIKIYFKVE